MSKSTTAAELMDRLRSDPAHAAMRAQKAAELGAFAARLHAEEAPLRRDLALAGCSVQSVWELVNSPGPYPAAIPVLIDHLGRSYSDRTRDGIARALAVPDSRPYRSLLVALYRDAPLDSEVKDGLAIAVAATSTKDDLEDVISLAKDTSLGSSRLFLLRFLRRSRDPSARAALAELRTDPDLAREISSWPRRR